MEISFDPAKRDWTLSHRGLDFTDALEVFAAPSYRFIDERFDDGEVRELVIGYLRGRMVVICPAHERGCSARHFDEESQ